MSYKAPFLIDLFCEKTFQIFTLKGKSLISRALMIYQHLSTNYNIFILLSTQNPVHKLCKEMLNLGPVDTAQPYFYSYTYHPQ